MNQKDGEKILMVLQDFINTELQAGNRVTKCNGNYLGGIISNEINQIITRDTDKEKMWEECGKEWLESKKKDNTKPNSSHERNLKVIENEAKKLEEELKKGQIKK